MGQFEKLSQKIDNMYLEEMKFERNVQKNFVILNNIIIEGMDITEENSGRKIMMETIFYQGKGNSIKL